LEEIMNTKRRNQILMTAAGGILVLMTVVAAASQYRTVAAPDRKAQLERGKYLVTIGGCHDCHTPWIVLPDGTVGPDMTRALSGHPQQFPITEAAQIRSDRWAVATAPTNTAFSGPWGVSFAANLSPDENTGTGIWTFDVFRNTIRNGRHWGVSRPLLPPMPWFNYREMTDEDLEAVFTYIHSLPPIRNNVQTPLPPAGETRVAMEENSSTAIIQ
jgi:mono/diheme cytochrome c family protein